MAPPVHKNQHREPAWSQPSPTIPQDLWGPREGAGNTPYNEVSPISTPRESLGRRSSEEPPISPIESLRPFAAQSSLPVPSQFQSLIPIRVSPHLSHSTGQGNLRKEQTKWDPYSGEPNESGVPASTRPGIVPLEQQYPQLKERTKQILAGLREREQAKIPTWGRPPPPVAAESSDNLPPNQQWKREQTRKVLDDMSNIRVEPLKLPQRNISRQDPEIAMAAKSAPLSDSRIEDESIHFGVTHPVTDRIVPTLKSEQPILTIRTVASDESIRSIGDIKPIAPLRIKSRDPTPTQMYYSGSDPSSSPPRATESKTLQSPFRSPHPPKVFEELMPVSSIRTESPHHDPGPVTPRTPTPESFHSAKPQAVQHMEHEVSRFSWTTYATSVDESPGPGARLVRDSSPPPPIPPMPTIRKRPVSTKFNDTLYMSADDAKSQGSIVIRKPVARRAKAPSASHLKHLSLTKTLPQLPAEFSSGDKIGNYESQLEALNRRKHNVNRIMKELSENLKKNQINYDARKRKEVQAQIQNYEEELQTIFNEQHDIGLLMHRAMKKRDADDNYEHPTGLWIRRVTN